MDTNLPYIKSLKPKHLKKTQNVEIKKLRIDLQ